MSGIRRQADAAIMYGRIEHDELEFDYDIEQKSAETFGIEPAKH